MDWMRLRDALLASGKLPSTAPIAPLPPDIFSDDLWRSEIAAREWVDIVRTMILWRVVIKLYWDHAPRVFQMRGEYSEVMHRARQLFSKFESIHCEPAGIGDESADTRLNLLSLVAKG